MSPDQLAARRFLFALLIGALVLVGFVAQPIAEALFVAAVLAVVLQPLQARLARWLRGRPQVSAALLVAAVALLVVGPVLALSALALREVTGGVRFLHEILRSEGMSGLLQRLPVPIAEYAERALGYLGDFGASVESQVREQGPKAASAAPSSPPVRSSSSSR
jgi:predicted PurR-regulated permease PerM